VRYLLEGEATGGAFAVVEHPIAPRVLAAPVHTHEREDEYSYVLEGRVGFQVGDEMRESGPGELVAKPRGTPHAFWNPATSRLGCWRSSARPGSRSTSASWRRCSRATGHPTSPPLERCRLATP
jgi:mannose-6-phosphate isomerase-like protein (cupin superfamily)